MPPGYHNPHSKFLVMLGFFMQSMRTLRRTQLCVNITQEVEPGLICKEGDMRNINSFRLNKICKPFTVMDSFFMIHQFQFLLRFVWEEFQFFSDHFMRCCNPISSSCTNLCNDFDGLYRIVRNVLLLLTVKFRWSPNSFGI